MDIECPRYHKIVKVLVDLPDEKVYRTKISYEEYPVINWAHGGCGYIDLSWELPFTAWLKDRNDDDYLYGIPGTKGTCTLFQKFPWGVRVGLDNGHPYRFSDAEFERQLESWYHALRSL
jgi:hypothetical protein